MADDFGKWLASKSREFGVEPLPSQTEPSNFLELVAKNPHGYGGFLPAEPASDQPASDEPTYRMTMLPFGTYAGPDGKEHLGFAVPGMIQEPINALYRLAQNSVDENGNIAIPNPENPQNREDVLTGLLSMYGGNALNPLTRVPEGALASNAVRSEASPVVRGYHGTATELPIERFNPNAKRMSGGEDESAVWFSPSPDIASRFADVTAADFQGNRAAVYPADIDTTGFKRIAPDNGFDWRSHMTDDQGPYQTYDSGFFGDQIRRAREEGHPGVVFERVWEGPLPQDQIAVLQPGRVTSPLTGETLFSDTGQPSLMGSALASSTEPDPSFKDDLLRMMNDYGIAPPVSQAPSQPANYLIGH